MERKSAFNFPTEFFFCLIRPWQGKGSTTSIPMEPQKKNSMERKSAFNFPTEFFFCLISPWQGKGSTKSIPTEPPGINRHFHSVELKEATLRLPFFVYTSGPRRIYFKPHTYIRKRRDIHTSRPSRPVMFAATSFLGRVTFYCGRPYVFRRKPLRLPADAPYDFVS